MEDDVRREEKKQSRQSKKRKEAEDPFESDYEYEAIPVEEGDSESEGRAEPEGRGEGDQDPPDPNQPAEAPKAFRFNRKSVMLTYSQCPVKEEDFLGKLLGLQDRIKLCFAKQEQHQDGSFHLHVFVLFTQKLDSRNPRIFDIQDGLTRYHPNMRKLRGRGKEDLQGVYEYLCKDGGIPKQLVGRINLFPNSKDFLKRSRDFDAWCVYQYSRNCPDPVYPLRAPDGSDILEPNPRNKRRHLWLHGPPSTYKTWWLVSQVLKYRAYKCIAGLYTFDNYNGEQIVYWNDLPPKFEQLLDICDTYPRMRDAPSQTRYFQKQIPANLVTLVIVTSNRAINDMFFDLPQNCRDALHERFVEYDMERPENQNFPRPPV